MLNWFEETNHKINIAAIVKASYRLLFGCDGYAIGGLSVGEAPEEMYPIVEICCNELPPEQPRYLIGVGTPRDLREAEVGKILASRLLTYHNLFFYQNLMRKLRRAII